VKLQKNFDNSVHTRFANNDTIMLLGKTTTQKVVRL